MSVPSSRWIRPSAIICLFSLWMATSFAFFLTLYFAAITAFCLFFSLITIYFLAISTSAADYRELSSLNSQSESMLAMLQIFGSALRARSSSPLSSAASLWTSLLSIWCAIFSFLRTCSSLRVIYCSSYIYLYKSAFSFWDFSSACFYAKSIGL